jgi:alkylation response protein AidB-like acyl-CoA dehydrogenase
LAAVVAFAAFGEGCCDNGLGFALASQLTSCQVPILLHGSSAVRERYLRGMVEGRMIAAHAASEPDAGSDVTRVTTRARRVDGGYRITGAKTFSSLAPVSHLAIVLARTEGDALTEFVVPRDQYQVSTAMSKIGLRTSPSSEVILDDAFVPEDHALGQPGSGLMKFMTTMEWERLVIMASSVGAMARQLDQCVAYARMRQQFGQPIGKFQAVSHRIAEMKVRLETSRLLLYHAAAKKDASGRATLESALVKLHVSESRYANALDAVRVFGGYGVMVENEVERELRDAVPGLIYSGTSDIQRNTIARLLGLPA